MILATFGVLQGSHVRQVIDRPGVYLFDSPDNLDAVESGLRMIRTGVWLRNARSSTLTVRKWRRQGYLSRHEVRKIPHQRFYDLFATTRWTIK